MDMINNMSIHGLTIITVPTVGWRITTLGGHLIQPMLDMRYRYGAQPQIGAWNLARFLEAISPLVENTDRLTEVLEFYISIYEDSINQIWSDRTFTVQSDSELISELNELLQKVETDMTIFFRELGSIKEPNIDELKFAFYDEESIPSEEWDAWLAKWWREYLTEKQ